MKEQLISFGTAKLAKEKSFDSGCDWIFDETETISHHLLIHRRKYSNTPADTYNTGLPTQSLLQRWLREVHEIQVSIDYQGIESDSMEWCYTIKQLPEEFKNAKRWVQHVVEIQSGQFHVNNTYSGFFESYEEALEAGLVQALKLI